VRPLLRPREKNVPGTVRRSGVRGTGHREAPIATVSGVRAAFFEMKRGVPSVPLIFSCCGHGAFIDSHVAIPVAFATSRTRVRAFWSIGSEH